jgi:hypothetical protein
MVCVKSPRGRPHLSFMSNLDLEAYINNIIDRTQRVLTIQHRNLLRADRSFECPFRLQTNARRLAYWYCGDHFEYRVDRGAHCAQQLERSKE